MPTERTAREAIETAISWTAEKDEDEATTFGEYADVILRYLEEAGYTIAKLERVGWFAENEHGGWDLHAGRPIGAPEWRSRQPVYRILGEREAE